MTDSPLIDDRPEQDSLVDDPDVVNRPEKETRIDRGSSDELVDDRNSSDESDPGTQSSLTPDRVDDGNQLDLGGDVAGDTPEWE